MKDSLAFKKMLDDVEWRKKYYRDIDPNMAVGLAESFVIELLFSADEFPFERNIYIGKNWMLELVCKEDRQNRAYLHPVENGIPVKEVVVWSYNGEKNESV